MLSDSRRWTVDEINLLIKRYYSVRPGFAFYPLLYKTFPNRTEASIRAKVHTLVKKGILDKRRHPSKRHWTPEELKLLDSLILKEKPLAEIAGFLKYRSQQAVQLKILTRPVTKLVKKRKLERINWSHFRHVGFTRVFAENWPRLRVSKSVKSLFIVLSRHFFSFYSYPKMAELTRYFCRSAQKERLKRIAFYVTDSPGHFVKFALAKKTIRPPLSCSSYTKNLIRASMIADGSMVCFRRKKKYYRFEICQAANYLGKTTNKNTSHAEYIFWFYNQLEPNILTPAALSVVRGRKKRRANDRLTKTWKIRLNLYNLKFFNYVYTENYLNKRPSLFKQKRSVEITKIKKKQTLIAQTSLHSLLTLKINTKKVFVLKQNKHKLRQLKTKQGQKLKKRLKLKQLPQNYILKRYYFNNPGLTLAHLHMQDGSALKMSSTIKTTSILHIQTGNPYDACRLAQVIYEKTGIKYLPKTTYKKRPTKKKKVLTTTLILCPGSINTFVKLTNQYMLPCFDYKKITTIDLADLKNKSVIERYEKAFNNFYTEFKKISSN